MPRRVPTALEKLAALEAQKQQVLQQRTKELIQIIEECNAFTIDDALLSGFLLFATNHDNKDHPSLNGFREIAVKAKKSARTNKTNNKHLIVSSKSNHNSAN